MRAALLAKKEEAQRRRFLPPEDCAAKPEKSGAACDCDGELGAQLIRVVLVDFRGS
jgi:hypothetical protein